MRDKKGLELEENNDKRNKSGTFNVTKKVSIE